MIDDEYGNGLAIEVMSSDAKTKVLENDHLQLLDKIKISLMISKTDFVIVLLLLVMA